MKIKETRKQQKWSQQALAIKSGVSRFKISMHECGYAQLTEDEQKRIVAALKNTPRNFSK